MTGTALVLGTNAGQADLIRELKSSGWFVIGCSGAVNEPGQALCDIFEQVDIRDVAALVTVANKHKPDFAYSISSDLAMKSVVKLAEQLDLPHYYSSAFIDLLDNKAALRDFLVQHDLSPVGFRQVSNPDAVSDWTHFPCVVKPTDGQGQRGVQKVANPADLAAAVEQAIAFSNSGQAIIEDFLDGVEVSCNVFMSDGKPCVQVLSERLVHKFDKIGIAKGHLVPAQNITADDEDAAMRLVTQTVAALGQQAGPLYFQMIITPLGPRIIEIAPRLDGCHMWRIIRAATGINLVDLCIKGLTGADATKDLPPLVAQRSTDAYELMFQQMPPERAFDPAAFPPPERSIYHEFRYEDGEQIRPINGTLEVVGYFVRAAS